MKALLKNIGWLLGSRGINAVLSLVYLGLATRSLGLTGFGRFTLMVVMAQTVAGIASFSTWQAVVRWGHAGRPAQAAGFAVALDLVGAALGSVLAAIVAWTASLWLPLPVELRAAAFALSLAAVLAIRSTPTGILRFHNRYAWGAVAETALPATRLLGAIVAWYFMPTIVGFVTAWAVAEIVCAVAYWSAALRLQPICLRTISLRTLPAREPGVWRFVLATNASRSLAVTAKQVIVLLVGAVGGAALAGGYRVAAQLGQALVQLGDAVSRAIFPELIRKAEEAWVLAGRMSRVSLALGLAAAALAALLGRPALEVLAGPEFAFAQPALVLLALAGAAELIGANWDALLVARGRPGATFAARAIPLACVLAAMPATIGTLGLQGVAACVLAASALSAGSLAYLAAGALKSARSPVDANR